MRLQPGVVIKPTVDIRHSLEPDKRGDDGPPPRPRSLATAGRGMVLVGLVAAGCVMAVVACSSRTTGGGDEVNAGPSCSAEPVVCRGHSGFVTAIAITPEGRIASADSDGTILVWEPNETGTEPKPFQSDADFIAAVAPLPDGKIAFAADANAGQGAGSDGGDVVGIWDTNSSGEPQLLTESAGFVTGALAVDDHLAIVGEPVALRVWNPEDGSEPWRLAEVEERDASGVTRLGTGELVVAESTDQVTIREFPPTSSPPTVLDIGFTPTAIATLSDGRLALGGLTGVVAVLDTAATNQTPTVLSDRQPGDLPTGDPVLGIAALPDGTFVTGTRAGDLQQWNPEVPGEPIATVVEDRRFVGEAMAAFPDGRLATAGVDGEIHVWRLEGGDS